jgi:hypothetical protein
LFQKSLVDYYVYFTINERVPIVIGQPFKPYLLSLVHLWNTDTLVDLIYFLWSKFNSISLNLRLSMLDYVGKRGISPGGRSSHEDTPIAREA